MLIWATIFLGVAIVAALLGFTGIVGTALEIGKVLFFIFFIFSIVIIFSMVKYFFRKESIAQVMSRRRLEVMGWRVRESQVDDGS